MVLEPLRKFYHGAPDPVVRAFAERPFPRSVEPLLRWAYPVWAGSSYRATLSLLESARDWSTDQVAAYQLDAVRKVLAQASAQTGTFRELVRHAGLEPDKLGSVAELAQLPLMGKPELRAVAREVMQTPPADRTRLQRTGGTTSSPDEFLEPHEAWGFEKAFFSRWYRENGFSLGDRMVSVTGTFGQRAVAYNPLANELNIYVHEFDDAVGDDLLAWIVRFDPCMIRGYPSLLYLLAAHILKRGGSLRLPRLTAVFLASEQLLPHQVAAVRKAFGVRVVSHYGQGERTALIQQCSNGPLFHVAELYSYVEFLRPDGTPATADGELATIVGTSFANTVTPLVRYATGDWVEIAEGDECPDCHRRGRSVRAIEGRTGDFIVTPSGGRWSATVLSFAMTYAHHMSDVQLVQTSPRSVEVRIVPGEGYTAADGEYFLQELVARVAEADIHFEVALVSAIQRPKNMKQRFVVSAVDEASTASSPS